MTSALHKKFVNLLVKLTFRKGSSGMYFRDGILLLESSKFIKKSVRFRDGDSIMMHRDVRPSIVIVS